MKPNESFDASKFRIVNEVPWEYILRRSFEAPGSFLVYGAMTPWWFVGERLPYQNPSGLPSDPRGGLLLQIDKPDGFRKFIQSAVDNPAHYGKHGLQAFALAYHGNLVVAGTGKPTCLNSWDQYNAVLDGKETT